jgi:GNAT superfamily N-acetyltransferase
MPVRECREGDEDSITRVTNEAFMHDAFFKLPEYVVRFGSSSVKENMAKPNARFFVFEDAEDGQLVGSIFMSWEVTEDRIVGNFSAVSVLDNQTRKGIGRQLVAYAEEFLCALEGPVTRVLEAGVINLREDLFVWYGKQGFATVRENKGDKEVTMISKPGLGVHLVVVAKTLRE